MIEDLLYRCPICLAEDAIRTTKVCRCRHCGATITRDGRMLTIADQSRPCSEWYQRIKSVPFTPSVSSLIPAVDGEIVFKESKSALLQQGLERRPFRGFAGVYTTLEILREVDQGRLVVTNRRFVFVGKEQMRRFPLAEITSITTDSHYLVFKHRGEPFFHVHFTEESPLKYENLGREILRSYWKENGKGEIVEFQPRVTFARRAETTTDGRPLLRVKTKQKVRDGWFNNFVYSFGRLLVGGIFKFGLRAKVVGRENLPRRGPFVLVVNHEGYLDSFMLIGLLPRKICYLAKNTELKRPLYRELMKIYRAIPVRRYEIDPSAIRNSLKVLSAGEPVGIFLEGERTWDGEFLPPKRGTVRFLLRCGVPVISCRIRGSFELLPRWAKGFRRTQMQITVGEPLHLPFAGTEIEAASKYITGVLHRLGK